VSLSQATAESSSAAPPQSTFDEYFEVEAILDHREEDEGYQYLVHWSDRSLEESTWEPPRHVVPGSLELILDYHERIDSWFGNIERILDRRPALVARADSFGLVSARYLVQWEGWEGDQWCTWERLSYTDYERLIHSWEERTIRDSQIEL
jgi:Chromo (CHRromatin Organisation MOdifier) domain